MSNEQSTPANTPAGDKEAKGVDDVNASGTDDYYDVDLPKKDSNTSIGDGEMRNEGLVGAGDIPDDGLFTDGSTNEQDEAENHDSEG